MKTDLFKMSIIIAACIVMTSTANAQYSSYSQTSSSYNPYGNNFDPYANIKATQPTNNYNYNNYSVPNTTNPYTDNGNGRVTYDPYAGNYPKNDPYAKWDTTGKLPTPPKPEIQEPSVCVEIRVEIDIMIQNASGNHSKKYKDEQFAKCKALYDTARSINCRVVRLSGEPYDCNKIYNNNSQCDLPSYSSSYSYMEEDQEPCHTEEDVGF